jgi:RNA polymerase sigma-70 factor (ECF subfamily)
VTGPASPIDRDTVFPRDTVVPRDSAYQDECFWRSAYEAHGPALLGFLRRRVGSIATAEDLLQELFVRAIRADSFRRDAAIKPYLYSIARNLIANQYRKPRLRLVTSSDAGTFDDGNDRDPLDQVADGDAGPQDRVEWREFRRVLAGALGRLSDDHRLAFELGVMEQQPYADIAAQQGWTLSRVKVNVHRARRKIIEALGDHIPGCSGDLVATAFGGKP